METLSWAPRDDAGGPARRPPLEDLLVNAALAVMVALPLLESFLRTIGRPGLSGAGSVVQHLTLVVGMIGGAIAAREGRLLALSTLVEHLAERWQAAARWYNRTVSATVTIALGAAAVRFVASEREADNLLLPGVPLWIVQAILPLGFALIAVRLLGQAGSTWRGRALAAVAAAAAGAAFVWPPLAPEILRYPAFALLLAAAALGAPVFVVLGGAGLILFWAVDQPIAAISVEHYRLVTNPALPSIPLFTLAGCLMAEGGAAGRLVRLSNALVGWFRGGPALATTLLCAFFTALTGGSGVTILALGGLLLPILASARYSERHALGLLTGAGSLGILLPPCLPVILYAVVAQVGIREMYLGGFLPGLLLIVLTLAWGVWAGRRGVAAVPAFDFREARRAVWEAKWELFLPVVVLWSMLSGRATPVEASALTAAYAFLVEVVINRDLHPWRDIPRVVAAGGLLMGGILLILGVALGLTNYLIDAQVPDSLAAWAREHVGSRWVFLLGLNVILILVGSIVEIYAAIVVVVPLVVPMGKELGLDPIHLGIIFLANMELGFLAPPIGLNLLLASSRFNRPLGQVARASLPILLVLFFGVLLITYYSPLTTWLPRHLP